MTLLYLQVILDIYGNTVQLRPKLVSLLRFSPPELGAGGLSEKLN